MPEIEIEPNHVLKSSLGLSYQWYKDNEPITGADARLYVVVATGEYKVEVTGLDGCVSFSDPVYLDLTGIETRAGSLRIYPNPASNGVFIEIPALTDPSNVIVKLHNTMGELVMEIQPIEVPVYLPLEVVSAGFYLVTVGDGARQMRGVVVKR